MQLYLVFLFRAGFLQCFGGGISQSGPLVRHASDDRIQDRGAWLTGIDHRLFVPGASKQGSGNETKHRPGPRVDVSLSKAAAGRGWPLFFSRRHVWLAG
ncbi:hypothetical protein B0T11DRAFT_18431 [Plectosphaerella cucumerina]|uniref:Secreted protein n=1 Tax=Plectosphaerella cucumerina TaxID=40658 RepID=A0A8K0TPU5_9PEZI|nr:hypothetical protein B0T11DRAFT_18431 [Plectosphaerella cucumerina]